MMAFIPADTGIYVFLNICVDVQYGVWYVVIRGICSPMNIIQNNALALMF